ncbi:MAG: hypothetical protein KBC83_04150 [Candidatus Moranbacteria bacterium]|nr:hypothetical protein [Candidatus Moranbacteria bacterium]
MVCGVLLWRGEKSVDNKLVVTGVGLILCTQSPQGIQIMVIREIKEKPLIGKRAGMLSFPLETQEAADEGSVIQTMQRCGREELGIDEPADVADYFPVATEFRLFPEARGYDIVTRYGIAWYVGPPDRSFSSASSEIEVMGWMTIPALLASDLIRVETRPVCEDFLRRLPHLSWG